MTTIDPADLKPGDKVRYSRVGTVERHTGRGDRPVLLLESGSYHSPGDVLGAWTFELLERPLPLEPPIGSVVVFRHTDGLEAWKRWHSHLGWLHAGNSTPRQLDRRATEPQGRTWAELLETHGRAERTVIEP